MKIYPLKLSYITKTALWAGKKLKTDFGKVSEHDTVSESWELSVREDEMSRITNGDAKGMTLAEYFEAAGYGCVSPAFKRGDRFPLLVKLIDASDMLSIQVHPNDDYALSVEGESGKTEMWYIVDAEKGATLVYGLRDGVTSDDFLRAVKENEISKVINTVPVSKGDTYFIPAGMLHAIGAGILVAEIQQNSDLTYRVYDFDRRDKNGEPRALHTDKALAVTRPYSESEINALRFSKGATDSEGELLASSEHFKARRLCVDGRASLAVSNKSFLSLLCIDGEGEIVHSGVSYSISRGDSYFLPIGIGGFDLVGKATLILSEINS